MPDRHYVHDFPAGSIIGAPEWWLFDNMDLDQRKEARWIVSQSAFDHMDDYTRSTPTAPSVGRIWKRNYGWAADTPDNWFIFVAVPDPYPGVKLDGRKAVII